MIDFQNLMATILYWQWEVIKGFNQDNKWSESEGIQPCPTLCDPMNCNLSGSSVCGIFQARLLEWVAISFSRGSSQPRDRTQVFCIADSFFTNWAIREEDIDFITYYYQD